MKESRNIELLIISDLFPRPGAPLRGIFVRDHARAVQPKVSAIRIADIGLSGKGVELKRDSSGIPLLQGGVFRRRPPSLLKPAFYAIWAERAVQSLRENFRPDLIHAHGGILSGTLARRFAEEEGIPFLITEHFGKLEKWFADPLKEGRLRKNYRKAASVIAVSEHASQKLEKAFPGLKSETIPNPVDTELFSPFKGERKKRVLFASRLDPNKGALRSLKAFDAIREGSPDWEMRIVGEGKEQKAIERYLKERPELERKVSLLPFLDRERLAEEMKEASFLVHPSEYESFGLVIAESLACGTPVIAPDRTGPRDIHFEGSGEWIPPRDPEALKRAMKRMMENSGTYDPEELHQRIAERFSMERVGERILESYDKALQRV